MVEFPDKIWAIEKGYPSLFRVSCSVLEHGPDEATEYVRADLYAALETKLAELAAENERLVSAANRALSLLDRAIGDTDPADPDNPLLLAAQTLASATGHRGEAT